MPRFDARVLFLWAWLLTGCQPAPPSATPTGERTSAAPAPVLAPNDPDPPPHAATPASGDASAFDPDIMRVVLYGERLVIEDSGHSWPVFLDKSTKAFVERGMAEFGTPVASQGPADCPAGHLEFLRYPNGLELAFQDDTLVGYWVREGARGVATEQGVHPGSPRSELGNVEFRDASFGVTADLAGVIALLDETGQRVTDMYAGAACIYD